MNNDKKDLERTKSGKKKRTKESERKSKMIWNGEEGEKGGKRGGGGGGGEYQ